VVFQQQDERDDDEGSHHAGDDVGAATALGGTERGAGLALGERRACRADDGGGAGA